MLVMCADSMVLETLAMGVSPNPKARARGSHVGEAAIEAGV